MPVIRESVVAVVRHGFELLAVWNDRYDGWSLPGGKVEENETLADALARELLEETGVRLRTATLVHRVVSSQNGYLVHFFAVGWSGYRGEVDSGEPGRPTTWIEPGALEVVSPFGVIYRALFTKLRMTLWAPYTGDGCND